MKPAMLAVVGRLRANAWPTLAETHAMLVEANTGDPAGDARVAARYAATRPDEPSGEQAVLESLRNFSMRWPIC